jgi:hypothetical protein
MGRFTSRYNIRIQSSRMSNYIGIYIILGTLIALTILDTMCGYTFHGHYVCVGL